MGTLRRCVGLVAVMVLAMSGVVGIAAPATAVPGSNLIGHRCRNYAPDTTNENTVAALFAIRRVERVWCEVDAWTIADGTVIIWHDATWRRVADHSTLPAGVLPGSNVVDATWQQVRQIRTKGGQPVARLGQMIDASAEYRVPLLVEIKNEIDSPTTWVARATERGARVDYYKTWEPGCRTSALDAMRAAGARIGLKLGGENWCPRSPAEMQSLGVSVVSLPASRVTSAYSEELRASGIRAFARGAKASSAATLLANGAVRLFARHPRAATSW